MKVSAPAKQPKNFPKFVFNLQKVSAPTKQQKKLPKFLPDFLKVSAPAKQLERFPKFVFNLQKVSALMMQPKNVWILYLTVQRSVLQQCSRKMSGFCT